MFDSSRHCKLKEFCAAAKNNKDKSSYGFIRRRRSGSNLSFTDFQMMAWYCDLQNRLPLSAVEGFSPQGELCSSIH
jgi:hypothetical protein